MSARASFMAVSRSPLRGSTAMPRPAPVGTVSRIRRLSRASVATMAWTSSTISASTAPAASATAEASTSGYGPTSIASGSRAEIAQACPVEPSTTATSSPSARSSSPVRSGRASAFTTNAWRTRTYGSDRFTRLSSSAVIGAPATTTSAWPSSSEEKGSPSAGTSRDSSPSLRATSRTMSTSNPVGPSGPENEYGEVGAAPTVSSPSSSVATSALARPTVMGVSGRGSRRRTPTSSRSAVTANEGKARVGRERGEVYASPGRGVWSRSTSAQVIGTAGESIGGAWGRQPRSAHQLGRASLQRDTVGLDLVQEDEGTPIQRGQLVGIVEGDGLGHPLKGRVDREAVQVRLDPRTDRGGILGPALDRQADPFPDQAGPVLAPRGEQRGSGLPVGRLVGRSKAPLPLEVAGA